MIVCPNCGKEVSEDAAHCGHCGEAIQTEQKKTMIGIGAVVDPEDLPGGGADASGAESGTDGGEDPSLAATELMEQVDLPEPDDEPQQQPDVGDAAEDGAESAEAMATGPTMAMGTVDEPAVDGPEPEDSASQMQTAAPDDVESVSASAAESAEDPGESGESGEGRWEIGGIEPSGDDGAQFDDDELEVGSDSEEPAFGDQPFNGDDTNDEPGFEASSDDGGSAALTDGGADGFDGGDRFAGMDDTGGMDAGGAGGSAGGNQSKRRRRLLMFVAVIFLAIAGCCTATGVAFFAMGGPELLEEDALEQMADELEDQPQEDSEGQEE